jgi:hypothetical protein
MGLIDLFMSQEKRIQRHTRRLTNRDSQPEDREASSRWLRELGTPPAIMGLLARFDMNLEHQYKDKQEKEFVFGLLASVGEPAVVCAKSYLRTCRQVAFPLRLLEELAGRPIAIDMALEILEAEYRKDDFKPDKKRDILVWLTEVRDPRCLVVASWLLKDFDEGVRYAAVEVIAAQEGDAGRAILLEALARPEEESTRLRGRLAELFATRHWSVEGVDLAGKLPAPFQVQAGRVVR